MDERQPKAGILLGSDLPDAQSLRYLRLALLAGLVIVALFDLIYLYRENYDQLAITIFLSLGFMVCLKLLQKPERAKTAMHIAFFISITMTDLSIMLDPVSAYWLSCVLFAMLMVLGRRAYGWVVYLMLLTAVVMVFDLYGGVTPLTPMGWINLMLSLAVLSVLLYYYLSFVEAQQKQVAEYAARLSQKQAKLETLEHARTIAGGIAHLINNEMSTIIMGAHILKDGKQEDIDRVLDRINKVAVKASSHADQLLAYTGYTMRQMFQRQDIDALLKMAVSEFAASRGVEGVHISYNSKDGPIYCDCDHDQLKHVILIMLENAVEACGTRGQVEIETSLEKEGDATSGVIDIRDDGEGMDDEVKEHIFEPFFSTKFTGRGLGLAAAYGIVKGHGGEISVESKPGEGSLFRVRLPMCNSDALTE